MNKKVFPEKLINDIISKTEGMVDEDTLNKVIEIFEEEIIKYYFDSIAQGNFYRVINSIFDPVTFLKEIINYPHHAEILVAIVSSSNYLTDIIVQNPEYLYQIFDEDYLKKIISFDETEKELINTVNKFKKFDTKVKVIRQFKKRYMLKIGLQDILKVHNLKIITYQLSVLAKVIISVLFELCFEEILYKYQIKRPKNKFNICALGKLGGDELNYSSDVDLIIFYDKNSSVKNSSKDFHEILSETIQLFTNIATQITQNGFIYRIDFRLRPDGKYSQLCKELNDYIKYYETRGEDWEKQMLIKLSYVSGDINLFNKFKTFVDAYVYQSFISESIKDKIKQMKLNIEKNNLEDDIKTFVGGIRDIEFSIQALQLLYGNKIKQLRNGNTLEVLDILKENNLLSKKEYETFYNNYVFYRKTEHFLQLMNDTQTHKLPDDVETQIRLSNYLKLDSVNQLKNEIDKKRNEVRKIYNSILSSGIETTFTEINFINRIKAEANLSFLKTGKSIIGRKEFDSHTIKSYEKIEEYLYKYLSKCENPDYVLDNFTKVIQFVSFPSIWFNEFKNEKFLYQFLTICNYSKKAIEILFNSKKASELFLSKKVFMKNYKDEFENLSALEINFILLVQHSLKLIDSIKYSEILSEYLIYQTTKNFNKWFKKNIFLAALGSLGSKTLSIYSDLDLIVVCNNLNDEDNVEIEFQNFVQDLKKILYPFEIDFRLRPEGKKAQLVWDIENYELYLLNRAKIWEFQSLSKIKFISGDKKLYVKFLNLIIEALNKFSDDDIKKEIKNMHSILVTNTKTKNIKNVNGGLTTIDFIFQYLILKEKNIYLLKKNYLKSIKELSAKKSVVKKLIENFYFLKEIEFVYQNISNEKKSILESDVNEQKMVAKYLKYENEVKLNKKINDILEFNIICFNKIFI
ncbi:MAG: hypothetical protein N2321_10315 [Melioribacteraceae bacterium]|nr:hypothetical protein [Melioribacteraceae bacterium]